MPDQVDKYRQSLGKDVVDKFLAKFGLGPKHVPKEPKKYTCPECHKKNATFKEIHPDTCINDIVLCCPDCGFKND